MIRKLIRIDNKRSYSLLELDKRAAMSIQNHFRLSNYQMLVLSWFKGLWTGILISLILHYLVTH